MWSGIFKTQCVCYQTRGRSIYTAAFAREGHRVVFGNVPFPASEWSINHYGAPRNTFDFDALRIEDGVAPTDDSGAIVSQGDRLLKIDRGSSRLVERLPSVLAGRPEVTGIGVSFVHERCGDLDLHVSGSRLTGVTAPIMLGGPDGTLNLLDPEKKIKRRLFVGHASTVTDVGESPDGRYLVSSSLDGTVRIWSLERLRRLPFIDFSIDADGRVYFVTPGGTAERGGIRVGDTASKFGGRDWKLVLDDFVQGRWPYRLGQKMRFEMSRVGKPYPPVDLPLVETNDVVEPLVSLYTAADREWVAWTPQGFYAASLRGDTLIGWRVNRGRGESAVFYEAQQMRNVFHQPEMVRRVLLHGDAAKAIGGGYSRAGEPPFKNIHDVTEFARIRPPEVRIEDLPAESRESRVPIRVVVDGARARDRFAVIAQIAP